jgi:prepilin-type processing-associated H-X9-DG protein
MGLSFTNSSLLDANAFKLSKPFACPSEDFALPAYGFDGHYGYWGANPENIISGRYTDVGVTDYAYNRRLYNYKITKIKDSTKVVCLVDGNTDRFGLLMHNTSSEALYNGLLPRCVRIRHQNSINVLYSDGHVADKTKIDDEDIIRVDQVY